MISKEELDKMDMSTLEKEMKSRRELREQMCGWLYPSILTDEIAQLSERHAELRFKAKRISLAANLVDGLPFS